jgi:hypothetical protein
MKRSEVRALRFCGMADPAVGAALDRGLGSAWRLDPNGTQMFERIAEH